MNIIKTEADLLWWLHEQLAVTEPTTIVTPGVMKIGTVIRDEVVDSGYLSRFGFEGWYYTFSDILESVGKPGKVKCGKRLITWLSHVYAEVAAGEPEARFPINRINDVAVSILGMSPKYLRKKKKNGTRGLYSTKAFEKKFGFEVSVSRKTRVARRQHVSDSWD